MIWKKDPQTGNDIHICDNGEFYEIAVINEKQTILFENNIEVAQYEDRESALYGALGAISLSKWENGDRDSLDMSSLEAARDFSALKRYNTMDELLQCGEKNIIRKTENPGMRDIIDYIMSLHDNVIEIEKCISRYKKDIVDNLIRSENRNSYSGMN